MGIVPTLLAEREAYGREAARLHGLVAGAEFREAELNYEVLGCATCRFCGARVWPRRAARPTAGPLEVAAFILCRDGRFCQECANRAIYGEEQP
jgi:hypothetical protein